MGGVLLSGMLSYLVFNIIMIFIPIPVSLYLHIFVFRVNIFFVFALTQFLLRYDWMDRLLIRFTCVSRRPISYKSVS